MKLVSTQKCNNNKKPFPQPTALDTEDWIVLNEGNKTEFLGYDSLETKAHILKYRKVKAKGKELYQIVLDKTPFYAESGGQVGDQGFLVPLSKLAEEQGIRIIDTKKEMILSFMLLKRYRMIWVKKFLQLFLLNGDTTSLLITAPRTCYTPRCDRFWARTLRKRVRW